MSVLVILIPPRLRLAARAAAGGTESGLAPRVPAAFDWVLSSDGTTPQSTGRSAPAELPRADRVVAVLSDADVAWQRVTLPRAPAARLRQALHGTLEDALLDDEEALHFALPPRVAAGQAAWVAVLHRPWLAALLAALEAPGRSVDRVVPSAAPRASADPSADSSADPAADAAAPAQGHFFLDDPQAGAPLLSLVDARGALCVRSGGTLARSLLPAPAASVRWTATPAAAAAAERWLGAPVAVLGEAERALQAAAGDWNLRQFDLAPRHRGLRALRETLRRAASPEWRALRWGAAALVGVQLLGLNLVAWQQRRALDERRAAMTALVKATHPELRVVVDPALQMQRETDRLRAAAGRPGEADLELLLAAAAAAWPDGHGPVQSLRFEPGRLTLAAPGWAAAQVEQFRERLRPAGYAAESADGRVVVTRGPGRAA